MQDSMALAGQAVNEAVSSVRVVRSFNTEKHEARRYDDRLMDIHNLKTRRDTVTAVCLLAQRVRSLSFFFFAKLCTTIVYNLISFCSRACLVDRLGHAGLHVVLRQAVHPEWTDDDWQTGFLHPLPVRPWRQH